MKLNKFVAHSGLCSRRKAAELVKAGKVKVNGETCNLPYYEVNDSDIVEYDGKTLTPATKQFYLLLNKPKDVITTSKDDRGRKTVFDLLKGDLKKEKLFTIGRLDRATTGLIILTNDGDLTHKLAHPSSEVKKIYHVKLSTPISKSDFDQLSSGLQLEDGFIKPDQVSLIRDSNRQEIGIELHSGKNRIIRRMFEHLNYNVERLDRVYFAGLTKKDLPRGRYRNLSEQELVMLRHFT